MVDKTSKFRNTKEDVAGVENLTTFNKFTSIDRYADGFIGGYAYVFFTRPSLFIYPYKPDANATQAMKTAYKNMTMDPSFVPFINGENMNSSDLIISEMLSFSPRANIVNRNKGNFMPLFTNRIKNFSPTDTNIETNQQFLTRHGYNMNLPSNSIQSLSSGELSFSVTETKNLDFLKITDLWVKYINNVTDGTFSANPEMIKAGVLDYMSSVYYFVTEPDGVTLKHWTKYTGVYPLNVPNSNMSYSKGDHSITEHMLNFSYVTKEEMSPAILEDFNRVSLNKFNTQDNIIDVTEDDYFSVKRSPLLSKSELRRESLFNSTPVVLYSKPENGSMSNESFKLLFDRDSITKNDIVKETTSESYFFDLDDVFGREG